MKDVVKPFAELPLNFGRDVLACCPGVKRS